jgi:uncharacterized protein YbbC (DUF1343 family)
MLWSDTGLPWFRPSPALPDPEQAILYSALGALEMTQLAVGRGGDYSQAFHEYGAPWLSAADQSRLLGELQKLGLPGLRFGASDWIPETGPFQGKRCLGFRVDVENPAQVQPFRTLVEVLEVLERDFSAELQLDGAVKSLGTKWAISSIRARESYSSIQARCELDYRAFLNARENALIYRE